MLISQSTDTSFSIDNNETVGTTQYIGNFRWISIHLKTKIHHFPLFSQSTFIHKSYLYFYNNSSFACCLINSTYRRVDCAGTSLSICNGNAIKFVFNGKYNQELNAKKAKVEDKNRKNRNQDKENQKSEQKSPSKKKAKKD